MRSYMVDESVRFCEENRIRVMDLKDIFILITKRGIVDKKEMTDLNKTSASEVIIGYLRKRDEKISEPGRDRAFYL